MSFMIFQWQNRLAKNSAKDIQVIKIHKLPMVDGRNPAPIDMVNISLFTGIYTYIYISQMVQDFFHQQFCKKLGLWGVPRRVMSLVDINDKKTSNGIPSSNEI